MLFLVALTVSGNKALTDSGTRNDAVKAEAVGIINSHDGDGISDREVSLFFVSRSQLQVSPVNDELVKAPEISRR